jgi:hypothetical protein
MEIINNYLLPYNILKFKFTVKNDNKLGKKYITEKNMENLSYTSEKHGGLEVLSDVDLLSVRQTCCVMLMRSIIQMPH